MKAKRVAAGIAGAAVCKLAVISRTKLSDVEQGYVTASHEEIRRIDSAIEKILRTRQYLVDAAAQAGLTLTGIRL